MRVADNCPLIVLVVLAVLGERAYSVPTAKQTQVQHTQQGSKQNQTDDTRLGFTYLGCFPDSATGVRDLNGLGQLGVESPYTAPFMVGSFCVWC